VHFTGDLGMAADYAHQAGGHVYEVEPTGDVQNGYSGDEWKSKNPLRVRRRVTPEEITRKTGTKSQLVIASHVSDKTASGTLTPGSRSTSVTAPLPDMSVFPGAEPESAAELRQWMKDLPLLFRALHDGLSSVAGELDESPVDEEITALVRTMASSCLSAAEEAEDTLARPAEGVWDRSPSPSPKA
jgi:hypothetical protein